MSESPFIKLRTDVRKDERFDVLSDIAGYSRHEAIGRMVDLWAWCSDRRLRDAPEGCRGYAVSESIVTHFLGARGVDAILGGGVDEFALGERWGALIYLRGTEESVSRLRGLTVSAATGGRKRVSQNPHRENGKFVTENTIDQPSTSHRPAAEPAKTSAETRDQRPETRSTTPFGSCEIPANPTVQSNSPVTKRSRAVKLADGWSPSRSESNLAAEHAAMARGVDLREELAKLRDWAASKAASRSDWDAVWRNWTRSARATQARRPHAQSALELQLERVAMLEREERRPEEK